MTSESDLFYEEKLAAQRASADALAIEATTRVVIRDLKSLYDRMLAMSECDMGDLSYAEAALFHNATEMMSDLLASIHDRKDKP